MAVHLYQLQKRYVAPDGSSVPVIDIESFNLKDGEHAALIGTSGSGKTTLLHMIAGILRPDSGRILFDLPPVELEKQGRPGWWGRNWPYVVTAGTTLLFYKLLQWEESRSRLSRESGIDGSSFQRQSVDIARLDEMQRDVFRGSHIGYIFQTHHLLAGFTAMENVLLGMSFTGRSADRAWAKHLLNEVGLSDRLDYRPAKLSVGQQQRVAVARALANRPKLVLADEPTGALDESNAAAVMELIRKLCNEVGASLLLVTHDLQLAGGLPRVVTLGEINRAGKAVRA